MKRYRVKIALEVSQGDVWDYVPDYTYVYVSAESKDEQALVDMYKALKSVGFYWRMP